MSSLFLGKIGDHKNVIEVHAFTKNLPFREFKSSEISDRELFKKVIHGRFELLQTGRAIYCTAVNPDLKNQVESNPHDEREGTVHIVSIDSTGKIHCSLSVAVDIGDKYNGVRVGVPLENRLQKNGFAEGPSQDPFRQKYIKLNYGENREIKPWEMAELYRHFKITVKDGSPISRLGTYIGCFHLMFREAFKKSKTPTWIWIFDAIPPYFNLYRYAGAAVLRDWTIKKCPRFISPAWEKIDKINLNGVKHYRYKDEIISRIVEIPYLEQNNGTIEIKRKNVPFLDGVIDIRKIVRTIRKNPITLKDFNYEGMSFSDRLKLLLTLSILGKKAYEKNLGITRLFTKKIEHYAFKKFGITMYSFN